MGWSKFGLAKFGLVAVALGLWLAGACPSARGADSAVTEIRIDDEGVKVGDEYVVRKHAGETRTTIRVSGRDVVRFGEDVIVEKGDVIEGDAVAIFGSVVVDGAVEGDAVAVGGAVVIGPEGEVDGDAVGVGGGVSKEPGGVVRGEFVSIGKGARWIGPGIHHKPFFLGGLFGRSGRFWMFLAWTIVIIMVGLLLVAVIPKSVENVRDRARREAFKMGLIGLLAEILVIPVMVLFVVTIIGIPIGLVVVPLLFGLSLLFGYICVSLAVGQRFGNGAGRSVYASVAIGILLMQGLKILGGLIGLPGPVLGAFGTVVSIIGWAVIYVGATVGLGAVIMSRFGTRPAAAVAGPPTALPPQVQATP